jgi:hypothetical protein
MHDATVSGMRCTGQYYAITPSKIGGAGDQFTAEGRAAPVSPADAL